MVRCHLLSLLSADGVVCDVSATAPFIADCHRALDRRCVELDVGSVRPPTLPLALVPTSCECDFLAASGVACPSSTSVIRSFPFCLHGATCIRVIVVEGGHSTGWAEVWVGDTRRPAKNQMLDNQGDVTDSVTSSMQKKNERGRTYSLTTERRRNTRRPAATAASSMS